MWLPRGCHHDCAGKECDGRRLVPTSAIRHARGSLETDLRHERISGRRRSGSPLHPPVTAPSQSAPSEHGKERMVSNVLASWGGQAIRIVAGFVMPRLIDRHLGQEALGAWDVSWSITAHLALIQ